MVHMKSRVLRVCLRVALVVAIAGRASDVFAQGVPSPASSNPFSSSGAPTVGSVLGPPRVTWLFGQGDANGNARDGDGGSVLFEPIRLSLLGSTFPTGRYEPGCNEHTESTGAATAGVPGFASQYATGLRLAPRLTLFGFGQGGCSVDAKMGGALVYVVPLRPNISLVLSAGAMVVPNGGPGGRSVVRTDLRGDVVFKRSGGRSYSVGLGTGGLTFGGVL